MERKIIITSDGSHSIYIPEMNEHYHSIHGAVQESKHVFIEAGLKNILLHLSEEKVPKEINILEIGFGTGLNALITFIESQQFSIKINYTSIESFPLKKEITGQLNYALQLDPSNRFELKSIFEKLHDASWEKEIIIKENFILKKLCNVLQQVDLKASQFDLIYFDAFGPPVQPEMWTEEIFSKIFSSTKSGGILVTYCAKGEVKRTLRKVGFKIENLPGPPGKREMVRARKG
jgi:tRNA U34 5-methylaminomethyl-2-thiouridine-forming methyltransferase MnmC